MNYVPRFNLFGVEARQIPCITGRGEPTANTDGAVGCIYMDTDTGLLYKCTAAEEGIYTWIKVETVPKPTADDAGKILTVSDAGSAVWTSIVNADEVAY